MATPLPVLYVDDGKAVLRFSEIFGIQEPPRKGEKKERRHSTPRGIYLEIAYLPEFRFANVRICCVFPREV